jgi:hypothetical protein
MNKAFFALFVAIVVFILFQISLPEEKVSEPVSPTPQVKKMWVITDRADRKACPDEKCGSVGMLFFREGVNALEEREGWVKITALIDAACEGNKSAFVKEGNASCSSSNGIIDGKYYEWVNKASLSTMRPEDPAKKATGDYTLIKDSDDYRLHKDVFAKTAQALIEQNTCTAQDFKEQGGWMKSVNPETRKKPIYFTYCGGINMSNKIYLNARTGKVYYYGDTVN